MVTVPQAGAVQADYILGPGDEIAVSLRGQENSEYRVTINRDGQVVIPRLNPIPAAGRTLGDFQRDLLAAAQKVYVSTQAFSSVSRIRQISVIVSGEVNSPGTRLVTGLSTPIDAILLSGGIKKTGSLRNVKLVRAGLRKTIDLYSILTANGRNNTTLLTDGDTIIVPPLGRTVAVTGWVRRQGIYELPPGSAALSVQGLLSLAGGLEVRGKYNMSVLRLLSNGSNSLERLANESGLIHDSEILFVRPSADQSESLATLSGGTPLAGQYPVGRVVRLSDILKAPGALGPTPYTLFGVIVRRDPATQLQTLIPFTPIAVLAGREDLDVMSNDVVRVFTTHEENLLAAVIGEFGRRRDLLKNQDQFDISQIVGQSATVNSDMSNGDTTTQSNTASRGYVANGGVFAQSNDDRAIIASLAVKTLGEAGVLSNRPASNENSPFGLTKAQRNYLRNQSPFVAEETKGEDTEQSDANPNDELLDEALLPKPQNQAQQDKNGNRIQSDQNASNSQPVFRQPQMNSDGSEQSANFQTQKVQPGQIPTNVEVQTFGQLARQLNIDPLILINFLNDHKATIDGSVRGAGLYLVGPDTKIKDVIAAAGGLDSWTDKSGFEVISTSVLPDTGRATTKHNLLMADEQTLSQYEVRAQDEIRFNSTFTEVGVGTVTIKGQVRYPGTYHVDRGERLSEILLRAGGLTDQAYPYGTVFLRKSAAAVERDGYSRAASETETALAEGLTRTGEKKVDPTAFTAAQAFVEQLRSTPALGRITAVADPAVLAANPARDTTLESGDVIFIPQRPSTIAVLGQVMQPISISYNSDFKASDYIEQAGGYAQFADESRTFLVLPDGTARRVDSSWLNLDNPGIPPGSTLVIPRDMTPFDLRQTILDAGQLLSNLAVSAASLAVLSKNN